jgi:hypothetical protein
MDRSSLRTAALVLAIASLASGCTVGLVLGGTGMSSTSTDNSAGSVQFTVNNQDVVPLGFVLLDGFDGTDMGVVNPGESATFGLPIDTQGDTMQAYDPNGDVVSQQTVTDNGDWTVP